MCFKESKNKKFWKLYSQNDAERIFQILIYVAHKLITPNSKLGSYFVEKGKWVVHTRNCRNQAGSTFIDLTGTTLSEDPGYCTQLCMLQLPSKMIIVFLFFLFFIFFFEFSSCEGWIEKTTKDLSPLCLRYWKLRPYFPPCHVEKSSLFDLSIRIDFIQPYLIGS